MKRKPKDASPGITRCWPLFIWEICAVCHNEFRRMRGWQKRLWPPLLPPIGPVDATCVCSDCAPDKKAAEVIFDQIENPAAGKLPTSDQEINCGEGK